jgi:hypothetical protein
VRIRAYAALSAVFDEEPLDIIGIKSVSRLTERAPPVSPPLIALMREYRGLPPVGGDGANSLAPRLEVCARLEAREGGTGVRR